MQALAGVQDCLFGDGRKMGGRELKETALEYGRPLLLKWRGKPVPERRAAEACQLVRLYARHASQPTQLFTRDGSPTEALKRVIGALTTHDDEPFDKWVAMIPKVLARPWWDGNPSIGVVFGPKVLEANLHDATGGRRPNGTQREGKVLYREFETGCRRCPASVTNFQANNQHCLCDPCYAAHEAAVGA